MGTLFSPHDSNLLTPAFVERKQVPFDAWGEVAEDQFCCWMDVQGRGDEVEAWVEGRELHIPKIAVAVEVALACVVNGLGVVMADADPVIETLEG